MKKREIKDSGASIRARLTNIAKETKRDFDALLLQYFQERFLYRLSISPFRSTFVLKGALLFLVYEMPLLRPTRDVDFWVRSKSKDLVTIKKMIQDIARTDVADGVTFIPESISLKSIMEDADYEGIRIKINGSLDKAGRRSRLILHLGMFWWQGRLKWNFLYCLMTNSFHV